MNFGMNRFTFLLLFLISLGSCLLLIFLPSKTNVKLLKYSSYPVLGTRKKTGFHEQSDLNIDEKNVKEMNQAKISGLPVVNTDKDTEFLEQLDLNTLKHLLHGLLTVNDKPCKNYRTFGVTDRDGGYQVCLEGKLAVSMLSCTVFSFGISLDWSFDDEIRKYGCSVHSFDPSIGLKDHKRAEKHWFHNLGLGKQVEYDHARNWSMVNIAKAIELSGMAGKTVDVMKVDAEGAEYPFLEDVLQNMVDVKQMVLEIHSYRVKPQVVLKEDIIYTIKLLMALKRAGYIISHSMHKTYCCDAFANMFPNEIAEKCCHEVYFYNKKYV